MKNIFLDFMDSGAYDVFTFHPDGLATKLSFDCLLGPGLHYFISDILDFWYLVRKDQVACQTKVYIVVVQPGNSPWWLRGNQIGPSRSILTRTPPHDIHRVLVSSKL